MARKDQLDPASKFYVVNWNTKEVLNVCLTANLAKATARKKGCEHSPFGNAPIAFVEADFIDIDGSVYRALFYNPRF